MKTFFPIILSSFFLVAFCSSIQAQTTTIGFGQLGPSNTTVPVNLGSNATVDGNGFIVSGGGTPGIALTWDHGRPSNEWDIHTSNFFAPLENQTVGGGAWDNEGGIPRVGQLDFGLHTILFSADVDAALRLNSFDFAHTGETATGTTAWLLTLTDESLNTVWSQNVNFSNTLGGDVFTIAPNFTGLLGQDYLLTFERISQSYASNGRHAIDNLSFSQVPEPSSIYLFGLMAIGMVCRRSRRK
ncbi:MAG TPA: PEP-CTERM sorting domain-containing protein [Pirellulaceae bacterium]|nr:PEP-CTERM sorting domain-containing protein [Pirellulaceae bacterium]HMO93107.1 PEP-CTERM sorting domain-containing protein [Pirellulaceae bacterium]HMP70334.1 PEP-CTERM sorting domain-containing protein [Pirellulaceae bacterium]